MSEVEVVRRWRLRAVLGALLGSLALLAGGQAPAAGAEAPVLDPTLTLSGFETPSGVATDQFGSIYVADKDAARVAIFDSEGGFVSELPSGETSTPRGLAVDSEGNLYVADEPTTHRVTVYAPAAGYEPQAGKIEYEGPPAVLVEGAFSTIGLAVNPLNDHLFVNFGQRVAEYDSKANGNTLLDDDINPGIFKNPLDGNGVAVDGAHQRLYARDRNDALEHVIQVLDLETYALLATIDGSEAPSEKFGGSLSVAVDEGSGRFYVYDTEEKELHLFAEDGEYLDSVEHTFNPVEHAQIAVDNGQFSPNGALHPKGRYLFAPSGIGAGKGQVLAFKPPGEGPPVVESVSFAGVAESEALLQATINPESLATTYAFQYTTLQAFEAEGFEGAAVAGEGELQVASVSLAVSAPATGLEPGTAYRFRVLAQNEAGEGEGQGAFATYPALPIPLCPNDPLRSGLSAPLPDCRAYELVTPPDTNARAPQGAGGNGDLFPTREASPDGNKLSFQLKGGALPGEGGTGSWEGDPYLASRGTGGWSTAGAGPAGGEATAIVPGGRSPDQGHSFWRLGGGQGSAAVDEDVASYLRYPDGHSELIGRGSLTATDPKAIGRLISEGGDHIIFSTGGSSPAVQLEPDAPPDGTWAIYDRVPNPETGERETKVVSLLPGDLTPAEGQDAEYRGASLDGEGVAFSIGTTLYMRHDNTETFEIGEGISFAGVAEGGERIFYLQGGNLMRFDAAAEAASAFTASGNVTPVIVSADGSTAYFVSSSFLTAQPNPNGDKAKIGQENLYLSREGQISFVGTLTERDVDGGGGGQPIEGLGLWVEAVNSGRLAKVPARSTPDGSALLFESRADLADYESEGTAQVYRYDFAGNELECLSCNPTGAAPSGRASLQSVNLGTGSAEPSSSFAYVSNLRADGRRAFFQSEEALVPGDTDGLQDVYEWEDQGVGSCTNPGGCVYLISSGGSLRDDYLFAISDSGDDVFFRSSDLLLGADADATASIYDARVGGGFAERVEEICVGEGCRPALSPSPALLAPATPALGARDNVRAGRRCSKGKRKVRRGGKVRCVKKRKARR